jgi:two-component system response regulator YesN
MGGKGLDRPYATMVVEDSKPILRSIVEQVRAIDSHIMVVATASDGDEAMTLARGIVPDIIITDIKMPAVDGIEFLEEARRSCPNAHCVIISGYDDFAYAQQAIKLDIDDYLLKPVDAKELEATLRKIIGDIALERKTSLASDISVALRLGVEAVKRSDADWPRPYRLSALRAGALRNGAPGISIEIVDDALKATSCSTCALLAETGGGNELCICVPSPKATHDGPRIAEEIREAVSMRYPYCNVTMSDVLSDPSEIAAVYRDLSENLDSNIVLGTSRVINNEVEAERSDESNLMIKIIESSGRHNGIDSFGSQVLSIASAWDKAGLPLGLARRGMRAILKVLESTYGDDNPDYRTERAIDDAIDAGKSYREAVDSILTRKRTFGGEECRNMKLSEAVTKYLWRNLHEHVTLESLSRRFNVSPSYLFRVMKAATGMSPMDYFMSQKIQEAQSLIRKNDGTMIKDIASALCFEDQHYFSRVFKKYIGITPMEYRESIKARKND